jgi:hypothetical protein
LKKAPDESRAAIPKALINMRNINMKGDIK